MSTRENIRLIARSPFCCHGKQIMHGFETESEVFKYGRFSHFRRISFPRLFDYLRQRTFQNLCRLVKLQTAKVI